jgi:hypothetical protein
MSEPFGLNLAQNLRELIPAREAIMAIAVPPSSIIWIGVGALFAWRLYSRVRRSIGRQKLSAVRPWITVTVFPLLILMLLASTLNHPQNALALFAGIVVGAGLGFYGLRLTRFEQTPEGLYYTPNAHLGIALSLLLIGGLAYRAVQLQIWDMSAGPPASDFVRSPLTLAIFGTLAGYYILYAVGLLRWHRRVQSETPAAGSPPGA